MPLSPDQKRAVSTTVNLTAAFSVIGASAHIGHFHALGFLDTKLSQALLAAKQFAPDGARAVLATLTDCWTTIDYHGWIAGGCLLLATLVAVGAWKYPKVHPPLFGAVFIGVLLLTSPAFQLVDMLREPPDLARVPNTRFAVAFVRPVVSGIIHSHIRTIGTTPSSLDDASLELVFRYSAIVLLALLLATLQILAPKTTPRVTRVTRFLMIGGIVAAGYYYGAVEDETKFFRTAAAEGHAAHGVHAAFVIGSVGSTASIYSFDFGNEDIDVKYTDSVRDRQDDILRIALERANSVR